MILQTEDISFKLFYTVGSVSLHRYVVAWKKDQYLFDNVNERGPELSSRYSDWLWA